MMRLLLILLFFLTKTWAANLYQWADNPKEEADGLRQAQERLAAGIANPEYVLQSWIALPSAPVVTNKRLLHLNLRDAILLALRYNPSIQNAELDRIIQRYELRLAHNAFELQYALGATAVIQKSTYSGVGNATTQSALASPELGLKTKWGTSASLNIDNNVAGSNGYSPVLSASISQPLLRGFGNAVNEAGLLDAIDREALNKIALRQAVIVQISQVIVAYRSLVLSAHNLKNQGLQLKEAKKSFIINKKKIAAGQLEPTGNIQQAYQIESLSLMVEQGKNEVNTAALALLQSIGLDPAMHLAIPSDVRIQKLVVPSLRQSIAIALAHNALYLAQNTAVKVDESAYQVARNQQLWQLDVGAGLQSGAVSDVVGNAGNSLRNIYSGNNVTESARLTLTSPLHDLDRRNQLIQAKLHLEKDRLNLIAMKRALMTEVSNSVHTIESLVKRYELAKKQVSLAKKAYLLEKKKQQAGIASSLDVNNTQNQWIQAQSGLIGAKIAYLNQMTALQGLLGTTLDYWKVTLRYGG